MRKLSTSLYRLGGAQSGMTAVGFGLLSAMIGVVIFGSAIALGFQASTTISPFADPADAPDVSIRETSVSFMRSEESSESSGMAVPAALKGSVGTPLIVRPSVGEVRREGRLAFGGVSAGAERAAAKDRVRLEPTSATDGGGARQAPAAGSNSAGPLAGAIAQGPTAPQEKRTAFETSTPMQLGAAADDGDGDTVIFDYPIPPIEPSSELQLGEDPLATAALEVPEGAQRPLGAGFALLQPARASARAAPIAATPVAGSSLLSGNFVLSFNLSDDQLMLVFMVTGLLAVATFLWLASSWLSDRSSLKRQRQWERQQAAAVAEAEAAAAADPGMREQVAA